MIAGKYAILDEEILLDQVLTHHEAKAQVRLNALRTLILERYSEYIRVNSQCSPRTWGQLQQDNEYLKENYKIARRAEFAWLRSSVLQSTQGLCAYCGNSNAAEVDHYLPQAIFAEFSVYGLNLVPACSRCNRKKSTRFADAHGRPMFSHPFLTDLPNTQFLQATVTISDTVTIKYSVESHAGITNDTSRLLRSHFNKLGLDFVYQTEALMYLSDNLAAYYQYFRSSGATGLRDYLRTDGKSAAAFRGVNHWKPVLMATLADDIRFCAGGFKKLGPEVSLLDGVP